MLPILKVLKGTLCMFKSSTGMKAVKTSKQHFYPATGRMQTATFDKPALPDEDTKQSQHRGSQVFRWHSSDTGPGYRSTVDS
jgi:hypothetical protein